MKYKCLILDHDDTCVDSTQCIHYPAHLEIMRKLRPHTTPVTLDEWFLKNFHPGISDYLIQELKLTKAELQEELNIWRQFTAKIIPHFYPGILDILNDFRKAGGIITVVSHSEKSIIKRHYEEKANHLQPDLIFGWDNDKNKRKPNPYPVQQILNNFNLKPEQALVLDDLLPGMQMAKKAGVTAVAAGWWHQIPQIVDYLKNYCDYYLANINELRELLFN